MANYVTITSDKKKWVAFFLCLFGGPCGLHLFLRWKVWKRHTLPVYYGPIDVRLVA